MLFNLWFMAQRMKERQFSAKSAEQGRRSGQELPSGDNLGYETANRRIERQFHEIYDPNDVLQLYRLDRFEL